MWLQLLMLNATLQRQLRYVFGVPLEDGNRRSKGYCLRSVCLELVGVCIITCLAS